MTKPVSAIVVMGICGCGKSTIASRLSEATGFRFVEGDDHHPAANISKMSQGIALTDADRWPWLARVASELNDPGFTQGCIVSCSALKRVYREFIRARVRVPVVFILPETPRDVLFSRLYNRSDHYMPPSLLDSQIMTFEPPGSDEPVFSIDGSQSPETLTSTILAFLESKEYARLRSLGSDCLAPDDKSLRI